MTPPDPNLLGPYGPWAAELLSGPALLSYRPGRWSSVQAWEQEGRARALELLGPQPAIASAPSVAPEPPRPRSGGVHHVDGLEVEELSWPLPYGPPAEALFLKPAGAGGPLPGVLALHDHGGAKHFGGRKIACGPGRPHPFLQEHWNSYYGGVPWANELARRGYAVLAHDVFPFGSRRVLASQLPGHVVRELMQPPEETRELRPQDVLPEAPTYDYDVPPGEPSEAIRRYDAFTEQHEHVLAKSLLSGGFTFPALVAGEDRLALSYLASRPEVDPRRLGACGLSGGGLRTVFLAGLDPRVACAVVVGFMSTWRDFALQKSFTHTWMLYVPQLPRWLDFPELLGLRAPQPSLVLATEQDPLFSLQEVRRAGQILQGIYAAAEAADRFRLALHPGPHCFNLPMQTEAFAWLDRWLA
jgi:dienelactone hydrolase